MPRSSKSFLFPDVNVWLAMTWDGHVHHGVARSWFDKLDTTARLGFCRFTQISLLRLLTTSAVMGSGEVMTQVAAWKAYDRWLHDDRILFLDEPASIEAAFRSLSQRPRSESKQWADDYLCAFATVEGMQLITFDRGFLGRIERLLLLQP